MLISAFQYIKSINLLLIFLIIINQKATQLSSREWKDPVLDLIQLEHYGITGNWTRDLVISN